MKKKLSLVVFSIVVSGVLISSSILGYGYLNYRYRMNALSQDLKLKQESVESERLVETSKRKGYEDCIKDVNNRVVAGVFGEKNRSLSSEELKVFLKLWDDQKIECEKKWL